jgi:zinc protease
MHKIFKSGFALMACLFLVSFSAPEEIKIKEFTVNGVRVIFKPSIKEIISVRLFIRGGTANYAKDDEGIEALALRVATEGGTKNLSMTDYNTACERIGANVSSFASYDFSSINLSCIKTYWDQSWNLFADAVTQPRFDAQDFEIIKGKAHADAEQEEGNPDQHLANKSLEASYAGRNYAKIPQGSVQSLEKLTRDQSHAHFNKVINKTNCFLVVVGNVTEADLTEKINSSLAKLSSGQSAKSEDRMEVQAGVTVEDRDIATNYIRGNMTVPALNQADAVPMRVAMSIMGDRFMVELRTKRSLTYAPGAYISSGLVKNPQAVFSASSTKPKEALKVMIDEINVVKNEGFKESELKNKKESFLTAYYSDLETNDAQTFLIGKNEIAGSWKVFETFMGEVEKVNITDLNNAFKKYSNSINWMYLGKQTEVSKEDFKQPQILPSGGKINSKN